MVYAVGKECVEAGTRGTRFTAIDEPSGDGRADEPLGGAPGSESVPVKHFFFYYPSKTLRKDVFNSQYSSK